MSDVRHKLASMAVQIEPTREASKFLNDRFDYAYSMLVKLGFDARPWRKHGQNRIYFEDNSSIGITEAEITPYPSKDEVLREDRYVSLRASNALKDDPSLKVNLKPAERDYRDIKASALERFETLERLKSIARQMKYQFKQLNWSIRLQDGGTLYVNDQGNVVSSRSKQAEVVFKEYSCSL